MLHYETVSEKMKKIAQVIFDDFDTEYYLAGGTALALQIGHRTSVDLDFFIQKQINTENLRRQILDSFTDETVKILFKDKNTLWCSISDVKVSFITRKDLLNKPVTEEDMFRLASIEDITVMKLSAICGRDEYKDYFDLACLSNITDVRSWSPWWTKVYEHVDMTSWLVALGSVEIVPFIDLDIKEPFRKLNVNNRIKLVVEEITNFLR